MYGPIYSKLIVDSLNRTSETETLLFRYDLVIWYFVFETLQGGVLRSFHNLLWEKVEQHTAESMQVGEI